MSTFPAHHGPREFPRASGCFRARAPRGAVALALVASVAGVGVAAEAWAYEIAVVQSIQNPIYDKTIQGFQATCGGQVKTYTLDKTTKTLAAADLAEIKKRNPSAILAVGASALLEIASKKPPMPVVFTALTEKPADITPAAGVLMNVPMEEQLETLVRLAPQVRSVGVVYSREKTAYFIADLELAAKARGLTVQAVEAGSPQDAVKLLSGLFESADAIFLSPDTTVHSRQLEELAGRLSIQRKKPVVGFKGSQLSSGFLFASEMDPVEMGKQAGDITRQVLAGRRPTPPYEPVRKYNLILNKKVAKQLDLTIPAELASGAKIFEGD